MIERNLKLKKKKDLVTWRKIALGSFYSTGDGQLRGLQKLEVSKVLKVLDELSEKYGERITLTHFMGVVCARMLKKYPQLNSIIRFGSIYRREDISLCFQVATETTEEDLSSYTLHDAYNKDIEAIAKELNHKTRRVKAGDDEQFRGTKSILSRIPNFLMKPTMSFLGIFMHVLNLWSPLTGMGKDSFGSMMITNIGSLGIQTGFPVLVHFSRVPVILAIGAVYEDAYSENREIKSGDFINLMWTGDHRLIDGLLSAKLSRFVEECFANPQKLF